VNTARPFRSLLVLLAIACTALVISACAGREDNSDATPTVIDSGDITIEIRDFLFEPPNVSVPAGTEVTWVNHDAAPHDATDNEGEWQIERMNQDDSDTLTFDTPGTFKYHCSIHPYMKGTLTVR
jgi:plastocyanin